MKWEEAVRIVTDDQNAGVNTEAGERPLTPAEAVAHARNILTAETLTDYGDDLTDAYRLIITQNADGNPL